MIVITGGFAAHPDTADGLRAAALEHVRRSRAEDGCISHELFQDAETPLRFFFYERWRYMAAVLAHFAVPASGDFVRRLRAEAASIEELEMLDADPVSPQSSSSS